MPSKKIISKYRLVIILAIILFIYNYLAVNSSEKDHEDEPKNFKNNKVSGENVNFYEFNSKYIIYDNGYNGLADRIKGIISTYAIALFSNRKFLINMNKPCNITDYLLPNEIDWNHSVESLVRENKLPKNFTSVRYTKENYLDYKYYNMSDIYDMIIKHNNVDVIYFSTNINWLFWFADSEILRNKILSLGYQPKQIEISFVLKDWLQKLFKFAPELQSTFDKYSQMLLPEENYEVYCAQIRTHDDPEKRNLSIGYSYWNFIKNSFLTNNTNYRIFVTSDFESIFQQAEYFFGKEKVIYTQEANEHFAGVTKCENQMKTYLDFFLMSKCDKAIIGHGEFGKTALFNRDFPKSNNWILFNDTMPSDFYSNMIGAVN